MVLGPLSLVSEKGSDDNVAREQRSHYVITNPFKNHGPDTDSLRHGPLDASADSVATDLSLGALLKFPRNQAIFTKMGSRTSIEGVRDFFLDQDNVERSEVYNLWIHVRDRSDVQIGTYTLSPAVSPALAAAIDRFLFAPSGEGSAAGMANNADHLLAGLVKVVERFPGFSWVLEKPADRIESAPTVQHNGPTSVSNQDLPPEEQLEMLRQQNESDPVESQPNRPLIRMQTQLPRFEEVAEKPESALDRRWLSANSDKGPYTTVEATIVPGTPSRVDFVATTIDENQNKDSERFSVVVPLGPGTDSRSAQARLESLVADAMHEFGKSGIDGLRDNLLKNVGPQRRSVEPPGREVDEADTRLLSGDILAGATTFIKVLPSKAQVKVSVGAKVAVLTVSASQSPNSAAISWVALDPKAGAQNQPSLLHRELHHLAQMLCGRTVQERRAALDGLAAISLVSQRNGAKAVFPRACSLDEVLGQALQVDLASFKNVNFSSVHVASQEQVLELLNGVQPIQMWLSNPRRNSRALTRFDRLMFGVYADGALSVKASNRLGGELSAKIAASTCKGLATEQEPNGYSEVIRRVARALNHVGKRQLPGNRRLMVSVLDDLVNRAPDSSTLVSPHATGSGHRIPPSNRPLANSAYLRAARCARVWALATNGDPRDVSVDWIENSDRCLVAIPLSTQSAGSLELTVSHTGAHQVLGQFSYGKKGGRSARLELDLQRSRSVQDEGRILNADQLFQIFDLAVALAESKPKSLADVTGSPLAKLLKSIGESL